MPALTTIQIRRGTGAEWSASLDPLKYGELGYDTTNKKFKIGDGSSLWDSLSWATITGPDFTGVSGIYTSYNSANGTVSLAVTGLNSSYINNFSSTVSGLLPVKDIVGGTNISVTSNNGTYTVSTDGLDTNAVKDVIGNTIVGVSGIRAVYNSGTRTETLSVTGLNSSYISDFNSSVSGLLGVKSLVQGSGIGISNNNGIQTISVTGIPSSFITDLGNIATTQVVGRTGVTLTYDVATDTMYIDTTGVSFVGHTHVWSNITDASTKATLAELTYLSGVSAGTVSASRALVVDTNKDLTGLRNLTTTGDVTVGGNLTIQGSTTTVNSTTVNIGDNIIRVNTSGLTTGGLEVYDGSSIKNIVWNTATNRWEFSGGNVYTSGSFIGSLSGNASTVTNGVYTTDTGTVTSTMIADNTIVNADINSAAAIAYSKLNLSSSIVNSDVSSSAAIAYSKLNLASSIVNSDISNSAAISDTKLATISTAGKVSNSATTATSTNTASAIVARDASGNFSAGTITANLNGNASTVTNGVYTTDTATVTNTMLAGSIANNKLLNSSVTIGSTSVSLGSTVTSFSGLSTVTATTFVGSFSGTATNVVTNANLTGPITSIGNATSISTGVIDNTHISATGAIAYSKLNLSNSIINSDISSSAAIAYSKLNLSSSIVNTDISNSAAIAYSKLNLSSSIVNADVSASAAIAYSKLNLTSGILNTDISAGAAIAYSKLNLSSSIMNADISSSAAIAVTKLASSGMTFGSTTVNLGNTTSVINGLTSISGTSAANPTTLYYCVIDGGTP